MIDLRCLRERMAQEEPLTLTREEGLEILAELESTRWLTEMPVESPRWTLLAQREMVAQLLICLSADVSDPQDARLVAGVVIQELAGLMRLQVRSEKN